MTGEEITGRPVESLTDRELLEEIARGLRTVLAELDGFAPLLSAFRPRADGSRAGYLEMAGAARALRRGGRANGGP